MKYYCWDCHDWVKDDKLLDCKMKNHDIDEHLDEFDPFESDYKTWLEKHNLTH